MDCFYFSQIIKIASEKDKIIKNLQSKYKKLIERFSEKQKEYELVLQNSKQFSDFCNKFHSSLEKVFWYLLIINVFKIRTKK